MGAQGIPSDSIVHRIAGYEPVCHLAMGGMAEVYLARSLSDSARLVVIKTLPGATDASSDRVTMFVDEMRIARLLTHDYIVETIEADVIENQPYLVLEFIDGPSLRDLAAAARLNDKPMDVRLAVSLAVGVCEGLQYAHELKSEWGAPLRLVHRDVSPQNLMVTRNGLVKILDFGVARAVGQRHETATRGIKGKIAYTAPEYIMGTKPDRRADIFALGVVLWELMANRRLFYRSTVANTMQAVLEEKIVPPSDINIDVPPKVGRAIMTALERDQENRWVSARAMRDGLAKSIRGSGGLMKPGEIAMLLEWEYPDLVDPTRELRGELSNDELSQIAASQWKPQHSIAKMRALQDESLESMDVDLGEFEGVVSDGSTEVDVVPPKMDDKE